MSTEQVLSPKTHQLYLSFLGPMTICVEGQPLPQVPRQKVAALLIYLVCNPGTHTRSKLAELLWDNAPLNRRLPNLRSTLNRLPSVFKPYLTATRQTISFEPTNNIWVDVLAFQQIAETLFRPLSVESTTDTHRANSDNLRMLWSYYQGSFLTDIEIEDATGFSEWQHLQREYFEQTVLEALTRLIEVCIAEGNYADGIDYAKSKIDLDPFDEDARRQLMIMLAQHDQQQAARQTYQALVNMLAEEFDVPPSPETIADYERFVLAEKSNRSYTSPLPIFVEPSVGRQSERVTLTQQLQRPDCRLVTVTGLGGIGKTYLAVETARQIERMKEFQHGVAYVPLAGVQSAQRLPEAIVQSLAVVLSEQQDVLAQVCSYLESKEMLIVLDNIEHLLTQSTTSQQPQPRLVALMLIQILQSAPKVKLLVTSRQPLQMQQEYLFPLGGMLIPSVDSPLILSDLITLDVFRLFVQVAVRNNMTFQVTEENCGAIRQFCVMVQGTPLAIVLGAAYMDFLSPEELVSACQQSIDILEAEWPDMPERQRSVRAMFEYTWGMLEPALQSSFTKLTVFQDGFTRRAAQRVVGASTHQLKRLHEQSLIQQISTQRYQIHELLRQFGVEKLAESADNVVEHSPEGKQKTTVRDSHASFYLQWLGKEEKSLQGQTPHLTIADLTPDLNNIRQAWQHSIRQQNITLLSQSQMALLLLYDMLGLHKEGVDAFTQAIQKLQFEMTQAIAKGRAKGQMDSTHLAVYCVLLAMNGYFHEQVGEYHAAIEQAQQALDYTHLLHDNTSNKLYAQAWANWVWSQGLLNQSDYHNAYQKVQQALSCVQQIDNPYLMILCFNLRGRIHSLIGQFEEMLHDFTQEHALCIQHKNRRREVEGLVITGDMRAWLGDLDIAKDCFEKAIQISHEIDSELALYKASSSLCRVALYMGEYVTAIQTGEKAIQFFQNLGQKFQIAQTHYILGIVYMRLGLDQTAHRHMEQTLQFCKTTNMPDKQVNCLVNLAIIYHNIGDSTNALMTLQEAESIAQTLESNQLQGYVSKFQADLIGDDAHDKKKVLYQQALTFYPDEPEYQRIEAMAALAHVLYQSGDLSAAMHYVEEVIAWLYENPDQTYHFKEPFEVYLYLYLVLAANQDERAAPLLTQTYKNLNTYAQRIDNPLWHRSYLENVTVNRQVLALWKEEMG
ncbi:MAG: BTAD domain-containing putative transcriptional regulator [Chloroflexota bacterium]